MKPVYVIAAAVVGWGMYVAWTMQRDRTQAQQDSGPAEWLGSVDTVLTQPIQSAAELVENLGASMFKISNMSRVDRGLVNHPNMRAMMALIRVGEGTAGANGYRTVFGGGTFEGYADHPRLKVTRWGLTSTAAGAYQALASTWDETKRLMNLPDFSPASQDLFCLGRIAARGAVDDVIRGDLRTAIRKLNKEWASLPDSPYGQKTMSWTRAAELFAASGGLNTSMA